MLKKPIDQRMRSMQHKTLKIIINYLADAVGVPEPLQKASWKNEIRKYVIIKGWF